MDQGPTLRPLQEYSEFSVIGVSIITVETISHGGDDMGERVKSGFSTDIDDRRERESSRFPGGDCSGLPTPRWCLTLVLMFLLSLVGVPSDAQGGPPVFSAVFQPSTIGPGSTSLLIFTVDNSQSGAGLTDLAFSDTLPAGVQLATPAHPISSCGGTISAPNGGSTLSFSDGIVSVSSLCTISVLVQGSAVGTHTSASGDLTSSSGNSGPASADLTVAADRPGFSKIFSPSAASFGSRVTLSFLIDNTLNTSTASNLSFVDTLPSGLVVAAPSLASTTCTGGTVTADAGSSEISLSGGIVLSAANCVVVVDLRASSRGVLDNISGELKSVSISQFVSSGVAAASIEVTTNELGLVKDFLNDPVAPGSSVTLEFSLSNRSRDFSATGLSFTDDLDATLSGLVATGLPATDVCGAGSTLSGSGVLSLTGGTLPPGASCVFQVTLQVPAAASPGAYPNTTGQITGNVNGNVVAGDIASDTLYVWPAPVLVKEFTDDPVGAGGTVTLQFTLMNGSETEAATDLSFTDELATFLPFPVSVGPVSPDPPCGAGSSLGLIWMGTDQGLSLTGGTLPAGGQCTFSITIDIPQGMPAGQYVNITSPVSGTVGGVEYQGSPAEDQLVVIGAPRIVEEFTDDPVLAGGVVSLQFRISHDELAATSATAISFSNDLAATIPGLVALGLPANDVCGSGSQLSGTTTLSFTGGQLAPGESCSFVVNLQVPVAASSGLHPNASSGLSATVDGVVVSGLGAADALLVSGLSLSKNFVDDPVLPGQTTQLEFTLTNLTATDDATNIFLTDSLSAVLNGLVASGTPLNDVCGPGSQLSGTSTLVLTGGNLSAGTSCTFSVAVQIPAAAADGNYLNVTGPLLATIAGSSVSLPPAIDTLNVDSQRLLLTKEFLDDPVLPGDTATLRFTIENLDVVNAASALTFSDDLDAALTGLVATGLPLNDVCGAGSQVSGTDLVSFTGGSLAAGASCSFDLVLQTPVSVPLGSVVVNTSSQLTGTILGLPVGGASATDELQIQALSFSKAFGGPTAAGQPATLSFTLSNANMNSELDGISFSDDLDAVIPGLVAVSLPADGFCGPGSMMSGSSLLVVTGASLSPLGSCTFEVGLLTPVTAGAGSYPNTTSAVSANGIEVAAPATAELVVEAPPSFTKSFTPSAIGMGEQSTLSFVIDGTANTLTAGNLDFTDDLPSGLVVATPANASVSCVGGTLTAASGTTVINYSGGTVPAGSLCQITVEVAPTAPATAVNTTGNLTSSLGNSGPASASLLIEGPPTFRKLFSPNSVGVGQSSLLSFVIDASANTLDGSGLNFIDNLPIGMQIANPNNASSTCTAGVLNASPGASLISYSGGGITAGTSCSISLEVVPISPGTLVNTTGDLTSSLGNSGPAQESLIVNPQPGFDKSFQINPMVSGGTTTLVFTIDNSGSTVQADGLDFSDTLPTGMIIANPANATSTCSGGSLSAPAGGGAVAYSGASVPAGGNCTISVDISVASAGSYPNTSSSLTSSLGTSAAAADTLEVADVVFSLDKNFAQAVVIRGGNIDLQYTITNSSTLFSLTDIAFSDDFSAMPGMVAAGLPQNDICGLGSQLSGTSTLVFSGGTLAPSGSCTFSVPIDLPGDATLGVLTSTSSEATAQSAGGFASAGAATDSFEIVFFGFSKSFVGVGSPNAGVRLEFVLSNPDPVNSLDAMNFTDDLDAVLPGLSAIGLPLSDICGSGSQLSGTSLLSFTGGHLDPGASCSFEVTLILPANAVDGEYFNITSIPGATLNGTPILGDADSAAEAPLQVNAQPIPALGTRGAGLMSLLLILGAFLIMGSRKNIFRF